MFSLISVLVDAFTDPLIGWICDRPGCNTKRFMLIGGVFTGILLGASFYVFPGSQAAQFVYYTVVTSLMWVSYTSFCIPYYACCVQMTDDYDEFKSGTRIWDVEEYSKWVRKEKWEQKIY